MEDACIVDLYWARSETAIDETAAKYGKYCYTIAYNILVNAEDAEESVNDTYLEVALDLGDKVSSELFNVFYGEE